MTIMNEQLVHLLAGGLGGTAGAVATCPLEVLKTRMQSSTCSTMFHHMETAASQQPGPSNAYGGGVIQIGGNHHHSGEKNNNIGGSSSSGGNTRFKRARNWHAWRMVLLFQHIRQHEGIGAFFKGLGPNLIGVAPSRAIYFCTYAGCKSFLNRHLPSDSAQVHIFSAASAGLCAATATNPIWLVKTRLQLDSGFGEKRLTLMQCIKNVYSESGMRGFYKGVQASYLGIGETIIHFVLYERLKMLLVGDADERRGSDFVRFMACGAASRLVAALVAYPHEVIRTRLREEGNKYQRLLQTAMLIWREEEWTAFYRGLGVHLIRTIPNTAIMMSTYELVVYLCLQA